MLSSTVTVKGQLTIPADIRKKLGVKPSDRVVFEEGKSGVVIKKAASIDSLFGSLSNPKVKPLSTSEMNRMIKKGIFK